MTVRAVHLSPFFDMDIGYEEFYTAKYMARAGVDVTVLTCDRSNDGTRRYARGREKTKEGFEIRRLPLVFRYGSDFVLMRRFARAIRELKPDLVFMHGSRVPQYLGVARRKERDGYALFVDHHDFFFPGHSMMPEKKSMRNRIASLEYRTVRKSLSSRILSRADRILPVTGVCRDHMEKFFGISDERVIEVEFAVDTEVFRFEEAERERIRSEIGVTDEDTVFNFTGVITRRKRFDKIVDLACSVRNRIRGGRALFLIVGYFRDPRYGEEISALIESRGASSLFHFTGKVPKEEIRDYYSASDAAFWIENNSISILEAMACRCVVFVPRMQLSHLVDGNGDVFDPGDIERLSGHMCALAGMKPAERARLGERSLDLVESRHSYGRYVDLILDHYGNLRGRDE
jgi:glycosyltransferase involved in cell wall biosynthesis